MDRPRKVELVAERYKFGTALEIWVVLLGLSPFMAVQPWIAVLIALLSLLMYREHIGRLARRGEPPIDVDAELQRLTAPAIDPALRDEIRQLVVARNERRARAGKEPLDVDAEIERQVRELSG